MSISTYIKYKIPLLNINIIKWLPHSKSKIHKTGHPMHES